LARKKKPVSAEEFAAWREDPVTAWVMGELGKAADAQKEAWMVMSWEGNVTDPIELQILKTRADSYRALAEVEYDQLAELAE
jgi:hypothetical protein